MLEEHWSRHPDLHHIKVYQASGVAKKALSVFQTYVGMMNTAIQEAVQVCWDTIVGLPLGRIIHTRRILCDPTATLCHSKHTYMSLPEHPPPRLTNSQSCFLALCCVCLQYRNPFQFKHVSVLTAGQEFHDSEPCVMLATPSMLQSGFSRELFEAWAGNPRNTVLIVDFAVQGTLARQLQDSPQTVTTRDNRPVSFNSIFFWGSVFWRFEVGPRPDW